MHCNFEALNFQLIQGLLSKEIVLHTVLLRKLKNAAQEFRCITYESLGACKPLNSNHHLGTSKLKADCENAEHIPFGLRPKR